MRSAALVVVLVGCGDGIALDDASAMLQRADCSYLVRCGAVESMAACLAGNLTAWVPPGLDASIGLGRAAYDGDAARACADALAARSCDTTQPSAREVPAACTHIVHGQQHAEMACNQGFECASQLCFGLSCPAGCCAGQCAGEAPRIRSELGGFCGITEDCQTGSICDGPSNRCVALRAEAAECDHTSECAYGLACSGHSFGTIGHCVVPPGPDEACVDVCRDAGTGCRNGTCQPRVAEGANCTADRECGAIYSCNPQGHCDSGIALGDPCTVDERCADPGASCKVGVCTIVVCDN